MNTERIMPGAEPIFLKGKSDIAVLCLHGFTGSPFEFRWLAHQLNESGYNVHVPLLAGHGTRPEDLKETTWFDWWQSAKNGYDLLKGSFKKIIVIGLSMGGVLGLHLAAHRRVDGLIVLASPLFLYDFKLKFLPIVKYVKSYRKKKNGPDIMDPIAKEEAVHYSLQPLESIAQLLNLLSHVRDDLEDISSPVSLIYSENDQVVNLSNFTYLKNKLQHVHSSHLLKESGHVMTLDLEKNKIYHLTKTIITEMIKNNDNDY
ncbi:MAG: carboxylesterase [Calditrichia bacterium]